MWCCLLVARMGKSRGRKVKGIRQPRLEVGEGRREGEKQLRERKKLMGRKLILVVMMRIVALLVKVVNKNNPYLYSSNWRSNKSGVGDGKGRLITEVKLMVELVLMSVVVVMMMAAVNI